MDETSAANTREPTHEDYREPGANQTAITPSKKIISKYKSNVVIDSKKASDPTQLTLSNQFSNERLKMLDKQGPNSKVHEQDHLLNVEQLIASGSAENLKPEAVHHED